MSKVGTTNGRLRGWLVGLRGDPGRWLLGQFQLERMQQQLLVLGRMGIAREHQMSAIGGRQVDVDQLYGG